MAFIIAIVSGILMSIQGVWNTRITEKVGIWFTNTIVQATALVFCMGVLFFVRDQNIAGLKQVNKWYFLSGVVGASIVYTVIVAIAKLGPAYAIMLILIAQVIAAYLIEIFGLFGTDKVSFEWMKLIGVGMMIVGIFIFQWKK